MPEQPSTVTEERRGDAPEGSASTSATSSSASSSSSSAGERQVEAGRQAEGGPGPEKAKDAVACVPVSARATRVWLAPAAWAIALLVGLYFFQSISTVLMGVLSACIISSALRPVMRYIPGPKGTDLAVLALGLFALAGLIGFVVAWPLHGPITRTVENWPSTKREVDESLRVWSQKMQLQDEMTVDKLVEGLQTFLTGGAGQVLFSKTADVVLGILLSLAFMLIGSIFLLSEPADALVRPALRLVSPRYRVGVAAAIADLGPRYRAWVLGTLAGMGIVFTASLLGYMMIGVKTALLLALLAGFAEIVPTIGPAIACAVAALFAAATQGAGTAAGVLLVYACIQAAEAYVILPMIMRGAVNIHPAVTLFSVVLWGKVFGVPGLIMAIPINLTIWTFLEHLYMRPMESAASAPRGT